MGVLTWFGVGGLVLMFGAYGSHVGFVYCNFSALVLFWGFGVRGVGAFVLQGEPCGLSLDLGPYGLRWQAGGFGSS